MSEIEQNLVAQVVAAENASNDEPSLPIFSLTVDCFNETFEYMSLKDLHSIGRTCTKLQKIAGEYFKVNYLAAYTNCKNDGIYMDYSDERHENTQQIDSSVFIEFIVRLCLRRVSIDSQYLIANSEMFKSLNAMAFIGARIHEKHFVHMKTLLSKVEILQLRGCSIAGNPYDFLLKYCKNLKSLTVERSGGRAGNTWLDGDYPKLEYLKLYPILSVRAVTQFFVRHPHVSHFSTCACCIVQCGFFTPGIQLESLEVRVGYGNIGTSPELFCQLLNQLHDRGFFQRLFLCLINTELDFDLAALKGLETLHVEKFKHSYSSLINLTELAIFSDTNPMDMNAIANSLLKLERLFLKKATFDDILPFVRRSPNLNQIKMFARDESCFDGGTLQLSMLNEERKKLFGACKVTIYVPDDIFLKTKCANKNGDMDLCLVEMKRSDSIEWDPFYSCR